ncbi:ubiquitin-conjugating enzyme/RWD-like protein [Xylariaceae sp. FL0016]|nr:ubiquitin-conjugating enzyme/RWD-like protein [Xylariaceae sp. FL0016]
MSASSSQQNTAAARLLARQLKEINTANDLMGISVGLLRDENVFEWEVSLMINDDCKYYGGELTLTYPVPPTEESGRRQGLLTEILRDIGAIFRAHMTFPPEYPHLPPTMVFQHPVPFHPNVYPTGELCISILHPPEDDKTGYESASERWSPVQSPETVLLSVVSLFGEPNVDSPANLDAAKLLREEREGKNKEFRKRVRACVRESLGDA